MPRMPASIEADAARALGWFENHLPVHHQTPAQPEPAAPAAPNQEDHVNFTVIAGDIKNAIENADQWVKQVTESHLPAILAQAQKYENSPIVQALETALLPPEVEAGIAATIAALAKQYPAVPAAPAEPQQAVQA